MGCRRDVREVNKQMTSKAPYEGLDSGHRNRGGEEEESRSTVKLRTQGVGTRQQRPPGWRCLRWTGRKSREFSGFRYREGCHCGKTTRVLGKQREKML